MFKQFSFHHSVIGLILILIGLWGSACQAITSGEFGPIRPTREPQGTIRPTPIPLTFSTLNADPFTFRDKYIRISGQMALPVLPTCYPIKGPVADWSIVAEELQMDVIGLAEMSYLAPEGASLTVDGVWRLYEGPSGCGKEPPRQAIWYLDVIRVVEPNPLAFVDVPIAATESAGEEREDPILDPTPTATLGGDVGVPTETIPVETATASPTPTLFVLPTETATPTQFVAPTFTATPFGGGVNATATFPPLITATPTPLGGATPVGGDLTTTPQPTLGIGTPSLTPTISPTPDGTVETGTPNAIGTAASTPATPATPLPTETPFGYVGGSYP